MIKTKIILSGSICNIFQWYRILDPILIRGTHVHITKFYFRWSRKIDVKQLRCQWIQMESGPLLIAFEINLSEETTLEI